MEIWGEMGYLGHALILWDFFLVSSFSMVVVAVVIQFIRPLSMLILSIFNRTLSTSLARSPSLSPLRPATFQLAF